ncbi:MAG: Na+/H+ antiporter subunit E [Rhodomicrobiaceae bacterium]
MRKLLPHPWLTVLLILVWAMLNNTVSLGVIVFGVILGILIPLFTAPYWPNRPRLKNLPMIVEYIFVVLWDIIVANVVVAWTILFMRNRDIHSNWVAIPLDIRTPEAITVLAGTITLTPGTVSSDVSADGRSLLVHCLNANDTDAVRDQIKQRYERRLKEIFE